MFQIKVKFTCPLCGKESEDDDPAIYGQEESQSCDGFIAVTCSHCKEDIEFSDRYGEGWTGEKMPNYNAF